MKIEELITGKHTGEKVDVGGFSLPVSALDNFMREGYVHIKPYQEEKTFSLWGKACTVCFTEKDILNKA